MLSRLCLRIGEGKKHFQFESLGSKYFFPNFLIQREKYPQEGGMWM